jgi:hypothetical protein
LIWGNLVTHVVDKRRKWALKVSLVPVEL